LTTKPFLILQLRPEREAADDEYQAILDKGGLSNSEAVRVRLDCQALPDAINLEDYAGVIVGGGPGCVSDAPDKKSDIDKRIEEAILRLMPAIIEKDFPYLGCCYGIGIFAHFMGTKVNKENYSEAVGAVQCTRTKEGGEDRLLKGLPDNFMAFVGHKEAVQELPEGCTHLVSSDPCPYQMIRYKNNVYATQFHPEADGAVFEARIRLYKDYGYFPPTDAQRLIEYCHSQKVDVPERILRNFIDAYRR